MNKANVFVVFAAVIALLIYLSAFVVKETDLVIKFQLGEIVKSDYEPGLYWLTPIFNNVRKFDRRIQSLDSKPEQYLTNEKKNVIVDTFVKWRITDVAQYYRSTNGDRLRANSRLASIVDDALKNQISLRSVLEVISGERTEIMNVVRDKVDAEAVRLGISVVDVRIKKLDYAENISGSVFDRMKTERKAVAKKLRSEGREEATVIKAEAERERQEILAESYRESQTIRGEGDAVAAATYAKAFGKNTEFYNFYRSLNAYKETFGNGQDILVLEPDSEFFRYFNDAKGKK